MKLHTFVSVSIADEPGTLGSIARVLTNHNVNVEGFSVERGSVHLLTDTPEEAQTALISLGHSVTSADLFEVRLPNKLGILAKLAEGLGEAGVNIVHTFGATQGDKGSIFLRVDDLQKARPVLEGMVTKHATA